MNSQNSFKTIEYPQELDRRIAELEKELAPFLNTQNLSFALKEILASATWSVSKILWVTSCSNVDNIIDYIDKYNEYVKLLKERNEFLSHTSSNIAYNYELRLNEKDSIINKLWETITTLKREKSELENKINNLLIGEEEIKTRRDKIAIGLKKSITKTNLNSLNYTQTLSEKDEYIAELNWLLREADLLDKRIKAEKIEDLYEQIRQFEPIKQRNIYFQKVIAELQTNNEELNKSNEKLRINLLVNIAWIFDKLENFQIGENFRDTINILEWLLKDSNSENLKIQQSLSAKDTRIQELERQLTEQQRLNISKDEQLARIDWIIELAKNNWNNTVLVTEITESIKPANNNIWIHPSHVAKIYNEHDAHHKTIITQAAWLKKYTQNQSE